MPLLYENFSLLLALPMWVCHLSGLYARKPVGNVMQWHYMGLSGLRKAKRFR